MIELALPAGSLETGLTAFKSGADAVYFGLKDFSARKGAVNFSFEDLSKIRRYSLENDKKIYLTINTLIDDKSIDKIIETLDQVAFYGNNGIIIQDLGVASLIRKYYPTLSLHGSTQLAVHTSDGVKELQDLGFERVVLSRELSLKEIEKIRKDCPDIELKAFIHGALCYGFSGLCSASFNKCKRSANGGECAQICRSYFTENKSGRNGYFFSMEDMLAGDLILKLNDMGIDSAKVEGRLKSPEYVAAVTRYYRSLLDRKRATKEEMEDIKTTFSRKAGAGYLDYRPNRDSLLSGPYPGHMGLLCGIVTSQSGNTITVDSQVEIQSHDGLQYFTTDKNGLPQSKKFSAEVLRSNTSETRLKVNTKDDLVGRTIYKISDSTKREKTQSTNIPPYKKPIDIQVTINDCEITAEHNKTKITKPLTLQEAKNPLNITEVIKKHFCESADSRYTANKITVVNNSSIQNPFLPPSMMKDFRRSFYEAMDKETIERTTIEEPQSETAKEKEAKTNKQEKQNTIILPNRKLLSKDLPWSLERTRIEDRTYFTLPPVTFDEERLKKETEEVLRKEEEKQEKEKEEKRTKITIGLNNIAQIKFAKEHPQYDYFADVFLYISNRFTAQELQNEIPNFIGGYLWFERQEKEGSWPFEPTIVKDFEMPSFISRTCYRHDSRGESCTLCPKKADYTISQSPDTFTVKVRNCLTVVQRNS